MNSAFLTRMAAFIFAAVVLFSPIAARGDDSLVDYKISPNDILSINVIGERDLLQDCRVTSSGMITYAWLSNVEVAGKTSAEVEQVLRKLLDQDYLVNPTVLVQIKEYRVREATVIGHVFKPGSLLLPAEQRLSIVEAISRAGGFTPRGNPNSIYFSRRGDKEPTRLRYDDLLKMDPSKMIYIEPGDVIEVKEKVI
jgi:polysaccharide export outer membrane protein